MPTVEISRTLVKSQPELWAEIEQTRLVEAVGEADLRTIDPERELGWRAEDASGGVRLEPSSWGTRVVVWADVHEAPPPRRSGLLSRLLGRAAPPPPPRAPEGSRESLERRLEGLLDALGQDHRRPFARED